MVCGNATELKPFYRKSEFIGNLSFASQARVNVLGSIYKYFPRSHVIFCGFLKCIEMHPKLHVLDTWIRKTMCILYALWQEVQFLALKPTGLTSLCKFICHMNSLNMQRKLLFWKYYIQNGNS